MVNVLVFVAFVGVSQHAAKALLRDHIAVHVLQAEHMLKLHACLTSIMAQSARATHTIFLITNSIPSLT